MKPSEMIHKAIEMKWFDGIAVPDKLYINHMLEVLDNMYDRLTKLEEQEDETLESNRTL